MTKDEIYNYCLSLFGPLDSWDMISENATVIRPTCFNSWLVVVSDDDKKVKILPDIQLMNNPRDYAIIDGVDKFFADEQPENIFDLDDVQGIKNRLDFLGKKLKELKTYKKLVELDKDF